MTTLRRKLLGDLRAQRGAFFAVWLTVALALSFYGATYPAGVGMIESFLATYDLLHYADFTAHIEAAPRAEVEAAVRAIDGVTAVEARLTVDAGLELTAPDRLTLHLIGLPGDGRPAVNAVQVTAGQTIDGAGQLLLLESFARYHGILPGDVLRIWLDGAAHDLTVAGLAFAPEYLVAGQSSLMPFPQHNKFSVGYLRVDELTALAGLDPALANDVALTIHPTADAAAIRAELAHILAPYAPDAILSRVQTPSGGVMDANIRGDMAVAGFFSAMFLLIGGLAMAVLLARLMDAETRRIGTMRALGLSRGAVVRHYLAFPLIIGVSGALVGSVLGYLGSYLVAAYFIQTLAGGSLPTFVNTPQWTFIAFGAGLTIVLALLAAALPTWRASGTAPGLALRPATPKGIGAQAQITIPGLPLTAQQALRNMLRAPARTLNTVLGVMIGFTVLLAASGTADGVINWNRVQFYDGPAYDLQVTWNMPAPATARLAAVTGTPGVAEAVSALIGPVTVGIRHSPARSLDTYAVSLDGDSGFLRLVTTAGDAAFRQDDAVWIGHNLARVLDLSPGDTVTLTALGQSHEARVAGIVDQGAGSPVFVPQALMNSWLPLGLPQANAALVRVESGQREAARRALGDLPGVTAVEVVAQTAADIADYSALFVNFSYLFQAFGYLVTLVVVFNTVSINLHERREELAIMRAMGARLGEIARALGWELLTMSGLGMILAVLPGWIALDWLMGNYHLDFFGVTNTIAPHSYLIAAGGVIAVVLLAEWLGLRGLRKADLGYLSKTLST